MSTPPTFLLVDDDDECRVLISRTLMRKFPAAGLVEAQSLEVALAMASRHPPDAVIVHRTPQADGPEAVARLKRALPDSPIIMVAEADRGAEALSAGATHFLLRDEWLRIGTVVQEAMRPRGA